MMDVLRPNVPWRSRRGADVALIHDERCSLLVIVVRAR
jgi:hypothetical protein